jgi:hypothetical protein
MVHLAEKVSALNTYRRADADVTPLTRRRSEWEKLSQVSSPRKNILRATKSEKALRYIHRPGINNWLSQHGFAQTMRILAKIKGKPAFTAKTPNGYPDPSVK